LKNPLSRFLVKHLFKHCSVVTVRDEKSLNMLLNWGIKAELTGDPAWEVNIPDVPKQEVLGIQLRKCPEMTDKFLTDLAVAIASKNPCKIKLFSLQKNVDFEICQNFRKKLTGSLPDSEIIIVEDNIIEEISAVKKLVAMRYHALIIGIKAKVNCVAINYDIKVQTLAEKHSLPMLNFNDTLDMIKDKLF